MTTDSTVQRPTPYAITKRRGRLFYAAAEVAAYRKARGVTGEALAQHCGLARQHVSRYERGTKGLLAADTAVRLLDGVDFLARRRDNMIREGTAMLARIQERRSAIIREVDDYFRAAGADTATYRDDAGLLLVEDGYLKAASRAADAMEAGR